MKRFIIIIFLFTAMVSFGQTSGNNPRVFNVKNFGAKGDGVTDDTQAIQAAINAANASGGGRITGPNGVYIIAGAINATYNSQLFIPVRGVTDVGKCQITISGESATMFPVGGGIPGGTTALTTSGFILKSTLSTFTTAGQSVIGTGTSASNVPNCNTIVIENVGIQVKNNPTGHGPVVGGISLKNSNNFKIQNVYCTIDTAGYNSTAPGLDVTGIEFPDDGYGENYVANNNEVVGFRTGYYFGEHVVFNNCTAFCCYFGLRSKTGTHSTTSVRTGTYWCKYDMYASGPVVFDIFNLDTEWQNVGKWYDDVTTVKDSANLLRGGLFYTIIEASVGKNNARFSISGAANLTTATHDNIYNASQNQNGSTVISSINKNTGSAAVAKVFVTSDNGTVALNKYSSTSSGYKFLGAGGALLTHDANAGDLAILNDYTSGNIFLSAGGASAAQVTIAPSGTFSVLTTSGNTAANFKGASGNTTVGIDAVSNANSTILYKNSGATVWLVQNFGNSAVNTYRLLNSDANGNVQRLALTQAGLLQLSGYSNPGVLSNDASGNITSVNTPITQATADLTAQTSAGNVTTFTVGSSTATFNISTYINVTAVSVDVIQGQITYTDENSTSQTVSLANISAIGNSQYSPVTIRAKNGTVITVKTNLTTGAGTITFDTGARITQL